MPRPASGVRTADAIQKAAAELFYQHGYEATTLRQVAAKVGIQVGSLYNHIDGKDDLLRSIMTGIMADLIAAQKAVINSHEDTIETLRAMMDCHIRFHAQRARDVFIGNSELRSLDKKDRRKVVSQRDEYEQMFRELIDKAGAEDRADVLDARLQAYAIVAMGTHVSSWYRPKGSMSLDEIVHVYTVMVLRQLGVAESEVSAAGAAAG